MKFLPRYFYPVIFILVALVFLVFEFRYAFHAWFLQDDFRFLWQYQHNVHWEEIIDRSNDFGRFISRNLYWYVLYHLFGLKAPGYYLVNLSLIGINTGLLFYFLSQLLKSRFLALVGVVSYFISIPMLENYNWLSNSQHILGHFFIVLFFITALNLRYRYWAILFYFLGIYANALMIFALGPVLVYWFFEKNYSGYLAGILILIGLVYAWLSQTLAVGAYEIQWSFSLFWQNLSYYFGVLGRWIILPFWGYSIYRALKYQNKILAFLVAAAICFYLPFAFLKYQHACNYFALSYLFNIAIIFYLLQKHEWMITVLFLILSIKSYEKIEQWIQHPNGENARLFVQQVQKLDIPLGKTVCFKGFDNGYKNTKGLAIWDIPPFWWTVQFGDAFKLFVTPDIKWVLYSPKEKCDEILVWDEKKRKLY